MSEPIRGAVRADLVFASVAVVGLLASPCRAGEPLPEEVLREYGLARSGASWVLKSEDDLTDRVGEIQRRFAEWKHAKVGLDEELETLRGLRRQEQELARKVRTLEVGPRPDIKGFRPPPFANDGRRGQGPPSREPGSSQPDAGPPPPPPDEMIGFGPGVRDDFLRQLQLGDNRRQYVSLRAELAARTTQMVREQVFSEDAAKRLETQLGDVERRGLEATQLDKQIRARYKALAGERRVKQALASLSDVNSSEVSLGPKTDFSRQLTALAATIAESKKEMLKHLAEVELKGVSRLTGLVAAAETLLQDLGIYAGRIQNLEREAGSRSSLLVDEAKQQSSLSEQLGRATDSAVRNQIVAELHAKEKRAKTLHAEQAQSRESIAEVMVLVASVRDDYLRIVRALQDAIATADRDRLASASDASPRKSLAGSIDPIKKKWKEFEKTIQTESVSIDPDKTINWVEVTLNGKAARMMVDLGVAEIRLSARLATELGVQPAAGETVIEVSTIDGRSISARRARLESVRVGPFTQQNVDCIVLPESVGAVPSSLGAGFFNHFSTRIDPAARAIVLTQIQVKPILHASKGAVARSPAPSKTKKTVTAPARSSANGSAGPR
jgi:clan AA aspartic protease (TIGR02281 family)